MNNNTLQLKVKLALNKLDSQDYDNIPTWAIVANFNKAQTLWCRRNAHGENALREGDEQSISRIDDLQKLIVQLPLPTFINKGIYFQSDISLWPVNYLRYKGFNLTAINDCCSKPKEMTVYLGEEADVNIYLNDPNVRPNYAWGETFVTITGDKFNLYHDNQFSISEAFLLYYRQPTNIQILGSTDPYTGLTPVADVICEFDDDLVELLIVDTASLIASDIESIFQTQRLQQEAEKNN